MSKYIWALIDTASTILFQFLGVIILARILTPKDYGIIGMMAIFISIGNLLVDSGMGGALVKKKDPNDTDYHTLFCFNLIVSLLFYLILYLSSNAIASFYDTPILSRCIKVYGLFVVISSFGIVQNTRLIKELRFKELAFITIIAGVVGLITAIILAIKDYGFWALIIQQLVFIAIRVGLQTSVNRFKPKLQFSTDSFQEQFKFGGSILLSNIISTIYTNITSSIIPKISSVYQNGLYTQASKIQQVPITILTSVTDKVVFPLLTKMPNDAELLTKARSIVRLTTPIFYIAISLCVLLSKYIVLIILGEDWVMATPYLQILFISGYGICHHYMARNIMKATGNTSAILKCTTIKSIIGTIIVLYTMQYGIIYILWGFTISTYICSIVYAFYLKKVSKYKYCQQVTDLLPSIIIATTVTTILIAYQLI